MYFKNLQIYQLPKGWPITWAEMVEQLSRGQFVGCPSNQPRSRGWVAPRKDSELVYDQAGQWLIALAVEERLLPNDVVRKEAADRADTIEAQQGYRPGRKQLREIKERVTEELMPLAFTRTRRTFAWIDRAAGYLVIDAGNSSRAEELINHLRHCLDDLPLELFPMQVSPQQAMADWLAGGEAPFYFTIDRDCVLQSEDKAVVTLTRHSLDTEPAHHIAEGKIPTKLGMTWKDSVSFVLTDDMQIKRLAFLDILKEETEDVDIFDSDFAIMTGSLRGLIGNLLDVLNPGFQ